MKVTLKDIARMANVSVTAVSLVLNNKENRISEEKKKEIIHLAKKHNYKANEIARSLVTNRSVILGLILPDIENIFFASLAQQLEISSRKNGYGLFITSSNDSSDDDLLLINYLEERGVDGIFICPSNESLKNDILFKRLSKLTIPFVMIDRVYMNSNFNKVYFDNEKGAYDAVKYLIEMGHKRIGCIAPPENRHNGNSRLSGYLKAIDEYNIKRDDSIIIEGDYKFNSGYESAKILLNKDITAVFSCNDMMTLGMLRYAYERGIDIPNEISVVSYDNILNYFPLNIEISSVEQDVYLLVDSSLQLMLGLLKKDGSETIQNQEIVHYPKFIVKNSVSRKDN